MGNAVIDTTDSSIFTAVPPQYALVERSFRSFHVSSSGSSLSTFSLSATGQATLDEAGGEAWTIGGSAGEQGVRGRTQDDFTVKTVGSR